MTVIMLTNYLCARCIQVPLVVVVLVVVVVVAAVVIVMVVSDFCPRRVATFALIA